MLFIFFKKFLSNLHTVFHCESTDLHSHQQFTRVPFSLHYYKHLLLLSFSDKCEEYMIVVLIFISLMPNDTEHIFVYLAVCMFLEKNVYSGPLPT